MRKPGRIALLHTAFPREDHLGIRVRIPAALLAAASASWSDGARRHTRRRAGRTSARQRARSRIGDSAHHARTRMRRLGGRLVCCHGRGLQLEVDAG